MAIKLPSHLHRSRSGTLHFHIAIPPDLRDHFASREIYRSLRTASVREAVPVAQALSQAAKRAFQQLRISHMSEQNRTASGPYGENWGVFDDADSTQPESSNGCADSKQNGVRLDLITEIHCPPPLTTTTINKNIERISSLFKFAIAKPKYGLRYTPFGGQSLDESDAQHREPLTAEELARLFSAAEHADRKYKTAYSYWPPLTGLLTGAR